MLSCLGGLDLRVSMAVRLSNYKRAYVMLLAAGVSRFKVS